MAAGNAAAILRYVNRLVETQGGQGISDGQLLQRFVVHREEAAFAALLRRHGRLVWGVCRHILRHEHDAEDAFQATFLVLARRAASIRKGESVGSWLQSVAYRVALRAKKMAMKRQERKLLTDAPEVRPAAEPAWRELQAVLDEELQRLPEKYRAPFICCCLEGRSRKEAAEELGWKEGTVSSRIAQARRLLQERLARRGVLLPAALTAGVLWSGTAWAAVPAALVRTTIKAAAGKAAAGAVSAEVAALMQEGMEAMLGAKLKLATALLLVAGVIVGGVGLAARQAPANLAGEEKEATPKSGAKAAQPSPNVGKPVRTDRYGDPLPEGAVARLGTLRFRLGNGIYAMALAPDGKTAVSVGGNSQTQFWNVATGKEIRRIEWKQGGGGRVVAYSRDSRLVATVQDHGTLRLWDAATGKQLVELGLPMQFTACLSFAPDSKTLAVGGGSYSLKGTGESNSVVAVWKWNGESLQPLWEAKPDKEGPNLTGGRFQGIKSLAFSPDGKHLATGALKNNIIRLWRVAGGTEVRQAKASGTQISALAFTPNGKALASGSDDGLLALWDPATGSKLREIKQPGEVRALAFSPDGQLVAAGGGPEYGWSQGKNNEPFLILWNAAGAKEARRLKIERDSVASVAFSRDGKVLAAGLGGAIRVWDPSTGTEQTASDGHENWIASVAVSQDGQGVVTAGGDGAIILWDLASGTEKRRLHGHQGEARAAAFVPGGQFLASAGTDQTIRLWDLATAKEVRALRGSSKGLIYAMAISPDGSRLAAGDYSDASVYLWDVATGKQVHAFKCADEPGAGVMCLAFSPNGKTLVIGEAALNAMKARGEQVSEARIQFWDTATGKKLRELPAHKYSVCSVAFSPDGRTLALTGWAEKSIRLWDVGSGSRLFELPCGSSNGAVAFSPDGKTLAWGNSPEGICLWEMASKKPRRKLSGHSAFIHSLAFAPDGRALVSGSMDTTALVWDATGLRSGGTTPPALSRDRLLSLWKTLASPDAEEADRSLWFLTADPKQAVPFIGEHLRDLAASDPKRIPKLIADLDSQSFETREAAEKKLEALNKLAEPALREAIAGRVSLEVRRRIERLLEKREASIQSPQVLQVLRAIEALERIGTAAAQRALRDFARRTSEAYFQQEAEAALDRLGKRDARK